MSSSSEQAEPLDKISWRSLILHELNEDLMSSGVVLPAHRLHCLPVDAERGEGRVSLWIGVEVSATGVMDEDRDRLIHSLRSQGQPFAHIAEQLGIPIDEVEAGYTRDLHRVTAMRAQQYIVWAVQAREHVRQLEADQHAGKPVWRASLALYRKVAQDMTTEAQRLNPGWQPPD